MTLRHIVQHAYDDDGDGDGDGGGGDGDGGGDGGTQGQKRRAVGWFAVQSNGSPPEGNR